MLAFILQLQYNAAVYWYMPPSPHLLTLQCLHFYIYPVTNTLTVISAQCTCYSIECCYL